MNNCFCCEKSIGHAGPKVEDWFSNPPEDATYWRTCGNYGSTVFDGQFIGEQLEMYICDECLKKKAHLVYHFKITQKVKVEDLKLFSERK